MPQTKILNICTTLSTQQGVGTLKSEVPEFEGSSVKCIVNLTSRTFEEFFISVLSGEGLIYIDSSEEFHFSVNNLGELIVICPDNYDFSINSSGELLFLKQ